MPGARPRERGAVAVVTAIALSMLVAFLALVMNMGHLVAVKSELQNAADASGLAGVRDLDGTSAGVDAAKATAAEYVGLHVTDASTPISSADTDIRVGRFDFPTRQFVELAPDAANLPFINAVSVDLRQPLSTWFSAFAGPSSMTPHVRAVAVGGGPSGEGCPLPIVLPSCAVSISNFLDCCSAALASGGDPASCSTLVHFTTSSTFISDQVDTVGFTSLSPTTAASNSTIRNILSGGCVEVSVGTPVNIQNGGSLNKPTFNILKANYDGKTSILPIAQMTGCPNPKFNQSEPVVGFATGTVHVGTWTPQGQTGGGNVTFDMNLSCVRSTGRAGGGFYGTSAPPSLVQ